jgi:hypothetical protein
MLNHTPTYPAKRFRSSHKSAGSLPRISNRRSRDATVFRFHWRMAQVPGKKCLTRISTSFLGDVATGLGGSSHRDIALRRLPETNLIR